MKITADSYPVLRDKSTIQRTPEGARLHLHGYNPDPTRPWKKHFTNSVNLDAARLLELCSGGRKVRDVVAAFNAGGPASPVNEEIAVKFFEQALGQRLVEIKEGPSAPEGVTVCGDYGHYFPAHVTVELTDQCNYFCKHCYRGSSPSKAKVLPYEKVTEFLGAFQRNGGAVVEFTGGEPMLHPDFFRIVEWAHARFPLMGILTNGYFLQEEEVKKLLPFKEGIIFNLSLDSCREEYHNKFRGKADAYAKTVNAMKLLAAHKFFFRVSMSVTNENFYDIEGTIQLARDLGASTFTFNPVFNVGRGEQADKLRAETAGQVEAFVAYGSEIYRKHKDFLALLSEPQKAAVAKRNCGLMSKTITLSPDGSIRPCVMFDSAFVSGNIYEKSYEEIFRDEALKKFASLPAPRKELCGDCEHYGTCGGCIMRGFNTARNYPQCRWVEKGGVRDLLNTFTSAEKKCHNSLEPAI